MIKPKESRDGAVRLLPDDGGAARTDVVLRELEVLAKEYHVPFELF